jgi:hypothetical protein
VVSVTATPVAHVLIAIAAVGGLAVMIGMVLLAARKPYFTHAHPEPVPGKVRGGVHLGDPRSQGPPEDEDIREGAAPAPPEPPAAGREPAVAGARGSGQA